MFSKTVEYALRAVVYMAGEAPEARTTAQIARATKVPAAYLAKVLQGLRRGGIVAIRRGIGGGVALAREPAGLTILDVVQAVEPLQRIHTCPLGLASHGKHLCPLHRRMDDALATLEEAFRQSTLEEVLADPSRSTPLCEANRKPGRKSKA